MTFNVFKATTIGLALGVLAAAPAAAHHSTALFDSAKTLTLKGTVTEFRWLNPHVILLVTGSVDSGAPQLWTIELGSPGTLTRNSWTKRTFKPGAAVSIDINPLRDGKLGAGFFKKATLEDTGEVLTFRLQP